MMRITPTCVGNTGRFSRRFLHQRDHPHLCGEHPRMPVLFIRRLGSPPPVWGTPVYSRPGEGLFRITPTCVGNTQVQFCKDLVYGDHPHLCGEHSSRLVR